MTAPGDNALWFMYEPVPISKKSWEKLNDAQKKALSAASRKAGAITLDERLPTILKGALPYGACMVAALPIPCIFPGLATWQPTVLMR